MLNRKKRIKKDRMMKSKLRKKMKRRLKIMRKLKRKMTRKKRSPKRNLQAPTERFLLTSQLLNQNQSPLPRDKSGARSTSHQVGLSAILALNKMRNNSLLHKRYLNMKKPKTPQKKMLSQILNRRTQKNPRNFSLLNSLLL